MKCTLKSVFSGYKSKLKILKLEFDYSNNSQTNF